MNQTGKFMKRRAIQESTWLCPNRISSKIRVRADPLQKFSYFLLIYIFGDHIKPK